jgi:hypothetical protein
MIRPRTLRGKLRDSQFGSMFIILVISWSRLGSLTFEIKRYAPLIILESPGHRRCLAHLVLYAPLRFSTRGSYTKPVDRS